MTMILNDIRLKLRCFQFRRVVFEAEVIPKGYGIAFYDFLDFHTRAICYPIPLSLFIRIGKTMWFFLKNPPRFLGLSRSELFEENMQLRRGAAGFKEQL